MKPNISAIVAITIDGKIARHAGHFTDWTSPEDKTFLRSLLDKSDAVVIGNNTYKTAEGPLSKRNCIVFSRAVCDMERRRDNLAYYNADGPSPIETILEPYRTVALLGGTQVYSYFLERNLIDDLYLTIDEKTDKLNFQVLPDIHKPEETPYHLFGTGYGDKARGNRRIHWMLYPHFPLENNLSQDELEKIISDLLRATEKRKPEIVSYMDSINRRLKERGEAEILG